MNLDLDALEAKARAATPGPWTVTPDGIVVSDPDADGCVADCSHGTTADARYIAAASPDVVLALIADVRLAEAGRQDAETLAALAEDYTAIAAELREARAESEAAKTECGLLAATLALTGADRDEARAECAACRGRPEGALPGWEYEYGAWHRDDHGRKLFANIGGAWRATGGDPIESVEGDTDSPRAAMRAAEEAARAKGW